MSPPIRLGFIPASDCAALVVAQERGFFRERGLTVELSREVSWATLREKVTADALDGAHMLAPLALASTFGLGGPESPILVPLALSLDGAAVVLAPRFEAAAKGRERPGTFGVVYPYSSQNYLLRDWLAASGLAAGAQVLTAPPPRMAVMMAQGEIDGFCAGEPWVGAALAEGQGAVAVRASEHWGRTPDKVLGLREAWAQAHGATTLALVAALLDAAAWCDLPEHRTELAAILARPSYVGVDQGVIAQGLGEIIFHQGEANAPKVAHGVWLLGQMARWGQAPFDMEDSELAARVYRPDIYAAARRLQSGS